MLDRKTLVLILTATVVFVVVASALSCSGLPTAVVTSATIPNIIALPGEVALYRFTVSAEDDIIEVEEINFSSDPVLLFVHPRLNPHLYDDGSGNELPGTFNIFAGKVYYQLLWPIIIPKGAVKTFTLRGTVAWPGTTASLWIESLVIKRGMVKGLPTAITTFTVK